MSFEAFNGLVPLFGVKRSPPLKRIRPGLEAWVGHSGRNFPRRQRGLDHNGSRTAEGVRQIGGGLFVPDGGTAARSLLNRREPARSAQQTRGHSLPKRRLRDFLAVSAAVKVVSRTVGAHGEPVVPAADQEDLGVAIGGSRKPLASRGFGDPNGQAFGNRVLVVQLLLAQLTFSLKACFV